MIIFIPGDENKFWLEFSVYYILSVILNNSVVIKNWWLLYIILIDEILEESSLAGDQWKYRKHFSLQWNIFFYSENRENENTHFSSAIFSIFHV